MVFLVNPPEYQALEEDFAWEKTYAAKKEASRGSTQLSPLARVARHKFRTLRDRSQKFRHWFGDGNVLDIGCGDGHRIIPPMTPFGIELSKALHAQADTLMRRRGGYCLHGPGAETIWDFDEGQFDGIIMHSYLEHETAVSRVLRGARRALKSTGRMFVRVPNYASLNRRVVGAKWCGFRYPDHVNYFTPRTLADVARRAGFSMSITNRLTLPLDDNINALFSPA